MNVKTIPFNASQKALAISVAVTLGALSFLRESDAEIDQNYTHAQPSEYGVQSLKLTSDTTGISIIKLDGFRIQVSFDFEAHVDSYGVPGSDFTVIEITNLAIDQVTDANGNPYNDFTDYNDHRNINLLLSGFIEKNRLTET